MAGGRFDLTPLYKALTSVCPSTPGHVSHLQEDGQVDTALRGDYGQSYLHLLLGNFDVSLAPVVINLIYQLADAGVEVNAVDRAGNCPLHVALINQVHPNVLTALIRVGADLLLTNQHGQDALSLSGTNKSAQAVIKWFYPGLAQSVRVRDKVKLQMGVEGWCALHGGEGERGIVSLAEDVGDVEAVEYIKNNKNTNALVHSVIAGDVRGVLETLEKANVEVNVKDPTFFTDEGNLIQFPLLAYAIYIEMYDTAKAILKKSSSVDVNIPITSKENENVPLFFFILVHCHRVPGDIYKYILKKADLDLVRHKQFELLLRCCELGHGPEVLYQFDTKGWTPFIREGGGRWLREAVLENCVHLSRAGIRERLFWVDAMVVDMAAEGATERLSELLMSGYDYINVTTPRGVGVGQIASAAGHADTALLLDTVDEFVDQRWKLQLAIRRGHLPQVKVLTSQTQAQSRDHTGRTPLITAAIFDRKYIVAHLLKQHVDMVDLRDAFGRTALHYACALQEGNAIEKLLLEAGAESESKDKEGKIPTDYRATQGFPTLLHTERTRETGDHFYILNRYLDMLDAIDTGKIDNIRRITSKMLGHSLSHVESIVHDTFPRLSSPSPLWAAVLGGHQEVGLYLIAEGTRVDQTKTIGGSRRTLQEEANSRGLKELEEGIRVQMTGT